MWQTVRAAGGLSASRVSTLQKITLIPQTDAPFSAFFSLVCFESSNSARSEETSRVKTDKNLNQVL